MHSLLWLVVFNRLGNQQILPLINKKLITKGIMKINAVIRAGLDSNTY